MDGVDALCQEHGGHRFWLFSFEYVAKLGCVVHQVLGFGLRLAGQAAAVQRSGEINSGSPV